MNNVSVTANANGLKQFFKPFIMLVLRERTMAKRTITVSIDEGVAKEIETLTNLTIEEVTVNLLNGYTSDGRRRSIPMIELGVSWPLDWYKMMLRVWGENKIPTNVRKILRDFMMKDPNRQGFFPSGIPNLRNRKQIQIASRPPAKRPDRQASIGHLVIPQDWNDYMSESYPNKRSTYVKLAVYGELCKWPWPTGSSPSIPQGLLKFRKDYL